MRRFLTGWFICSTNEHDKQDNYTCYIGYDLIYFSCKKKLSLKGRQFHKLLFSSCHLQICLLFDQNCIVEKMFRLVSIIIALEFNMQCK